MIWPFLPFPVLMKRSLLNTKKAMTIHYNYLPVRLPKYGYPLFLVVAKGFGREPIDAPH
jgi:hypothetical protein